MFITHIATVVAIAVSPLLPVSIPAPTAPVQQATITHVIPSSHASAGLVK